MAEKKPDQSSPDAFGRQLADLLKQVDTMGNRLKAVEEVAAEIPISDASISNDPSSLPDADSTSQKEEMPPEPQAAESPPPVTPTPYSPTTSTGIARRAVPPAPVHESAAQNPTEAVELKARKTRIFRLVVPASALDESPVAGPKDEKPAPALQSESSDRGWTFDENPDKVEWEVRRDEAQNPKKPEPSKVSTETHEIPPRSPRPSYRDTDEQPLPTKKAAGKAELAQPAPVPSPLTSEKRGKKLPIILALSAIAVGGAAVGALATGELMGPVVIEQPAKPAGEPKEYAQSNKPAANTPGTANTQSTETQPAKSTNTETTPTTTQEEESKPEKEKDHKKEDKKDSEEKTEKSSKSKADKDEKPKVTMKSNEAPAAKTPAPAPHPQSTSNKNTAKSRKTTKKVASKPRTSSRTSTKKTSKKASTPRKTGAARYGDRKLQKPKKRFPRHTGGATPHHPDDDQAVSGS